jgi:hypothetical protein
MSDTPQETPQEITTNSNENNQVDITQVALVNSLPNDETSNVKLKSIHSYFLDLNVPNPDNTNQSLTTTEISPDSNSQNSDDKTMYSLYIGNVAFDVDEEYLRTLFAPYNPGDIRIKQDLK